MTEKRAGVEEVSPECRVAQSDHAGREGQQETGAEAALRLNPGLLFLSSIPGQNYTVNLNRDKNVFHPNKLISGLAVALDTFSNLRLHHEHSTKWAITSFVAG